MSMLGSLARGAGHADHDTGRANDATGLYKPESGRLMNVVGRYSMITYLGVGADII